MSPHDLALIRQLIREELKQPADALVVERLREGVWEGRIKEYQEYMNSHSQKEVSDV